MDWLELLKDLVKALALPPASLLIALAVGIWQWKTRPRLARALVTCATGALWLCATPVVAAAYLQWVSPAQTIAPQAADRVQAIVILAGGVRRNAPEFGNPTLGGLTLDRVRYGAYLAKATGKPVLVAGGGGRAPFIEADLMQAALEREFGVVPRWIENRSTNTRENAAESARLLRPRDADGVRKIALVTHGFDVRRARLEFEAVGFEVLPAPTQVATVTVSSPADLVPSVAALHRSYYASYELVAMAANALGLN